VIHLNSCEFSYEFWRRILDFSQTRSCTRWRWMPRVLILALENLTCETADLYQIRFLRERD